MADDLRRVNSTGIELSRFSPAFQVALNQVTGRCHKVDSLHIPLESKHDSSLPLTKSLFSLTSSNDSSTECDAATAVTVVDTGCQRTAIGTKALQVIAQQLPTGLSIKVEKQSFRFRGVGGEVITTHVAVIPVCFGTRPGMIRAAILHHSPEAPFLISLPILKTLGSTIDLEKKTLHFPVLSEQGNLKYNGRGQLCIELFDFNRISDEDRTKTDWRPRRIIDDECFIFTLCTTSFVPPCDSLVVSNISACRTRDQDYYDHSSGVGSPQSPGCDTSLPPQGPSIEAIPSTRLSSSPVTSSLLIEPIPCNSHGGGFQGLEAHCGRDATTINHTCTQQVATSLQQDHAAQSVDDDSTPHDQPRLFHHGIHVPIHSGHDSLWSRCGGPDIHPGSAASEHSGGRSSDSSTSSPPRVQRPLQGEEGEASQEGKEEGKTSGGTPSGQGQSGLLRDGHELLRTQEDGVIQEGSSNNNSSHRAKYDGDVLLRDGSHGIHLLQAGTKLDETFPSLSQVSRCPVPLFYVARGGEGQWISTASTSQSAGSEAVLSPRSTSSRHDQLKRLRTIIQERQQQREGCPYFGRSKNRSSRVKFQSEMRSPVVPTGHKFSCEDEDVQNLRSSRNHPSEDRSGHSQCPYRRQSTQEVDQVELQESLMYQLPSGVRKRIVGELKSRLQELETSISKEDSLEIDNKDLSEILHLRLIGEVFSTPQFSRRAPQHDLQSGRAFDLQLGDQFLKSEHRQQCLSHLRRMKYGFVAVSCPCTMFSNLQYLASGRSRVSCLQDPHFQQRLRDAITLLNFGVTVCLLQEQLKCSYLFEHPWGASSWKMNSVRNLLRQPSSILTRTDQCCFGQSDANGVPIRKRTGFITNVPLIAKALNKTCKGLHEHQHCIGKTKGISRAAGAARYTSRMIDAVLRAYCKHIQDQHLTSSHSVLLMDQINFEYRNPQNQIDPMIHTFEVIQQAQQSSVQPLPSANWFLRLSQHADLDNLMSETSSSAHAHQDVYVSAVLPDAEEESMELEELPAERRRSLMREIDKAHKGMGHPNHDRFLRILKAGGASPLICSLAKTYTCSQCHENQRPKPWRRAAPPRDLAFNEVVGIDCLTVKHFNIAIKCLNIVDWGTRYQMIIPLPSASAVDVRAAYRNWVKLFGPPKLLRPDLGREFMQEFSYRCSTDGTELDTSSLEAPTQNSITEREGGSFKAMFHKTSLNYGETHNMDEIVELLDSCVMMKNRLLNKDGFSAMHRVFGYTPVIPGDLFGNSSGNIVEAPAMEMGDDVLQKQARMKQAAGQAFFSQECAGAIQRALNSGPRRLATFSVGQQVFFWSVSVHGKVAHPNSASRKPPHQFWHGPARIVLTQMPSTIYLIYQGRIIKAAPEQCRACSADEELSCSELVQSLCQTRDDFAHARVKGLHDIRDQAHPPMNKLDHPTHGRRATGKQSFASNRGGKHPIETESIDDNFDLKRHKKDSKDNDLDDSILSDSGYVPTTPRQSDNEVEEPAAKRFRSLQPQQVDIDITDDDLENEWYIDILSDSSSPEIIDASSLETWNLTSTQHSASQKEAVQSREIRLKDLDAHDHELFQRSLRKEWDTNVQAGAVSIISPHDAQSIRQHESHRIMQSRLLHTAKPIDDDTQLPSEERLHCSPQGTICKAKTRWIARGDKDPDVFSVESSSPVVGRDTMFMGLQIIASQQWRLHFADFSQAFMQGDPLQRNEPLYCELPSNLSRLMPEIAPGSLIHIHKTVYGLTDAPFRWNRHLDQQLKQLGYVPSLLDPCLYLLHSRDSSGNPQQLEGLILLATDDLINGGTDQHWALMEVLKSKYKFGKWDYDKGRFCGKDLQQHPDFSIAISQQYYVELKCKDRFQIKRGSPNDQKCTEEEIKALRGKVGILSWLAKETRVDLAGGVALLMQSFPHPTVGDLKNCNKLLKDALQYKDVCIHIHSIPVSQLCVVVSSDAAWGNAKDEEGNEEKSQAGYIVMLTDKSMLQGELAPFSMLAWKSHTLKRKTVSTLSAETQAIVESASVACWFRFLLAECVYPQSLVPLTAQWEDQLSALEFGIITDAKSVYDALTKPTGISTSTADKRTCIDLSIIREFLRRHHGCVRWIDGTLQLADSLTKFMCADFLRTVMQNGRYQLREEYATLQSRRQAKLQRQERREEGM